MASATDQAYALNRRGLADDHRIPQLVKIHERGFYYSALFAPAEARRDLLALYAVHVELSRIASIVTDPMLGQVRLKWWRDAFEFASPANRTGQPVADAFLPVMFARNLPREQILAMVDSQLADIFKEAPSDQHMLRTYAQEKWGNLFELSARILGVELRHLRTSLPSAANAYGLYRLTLALSQGNTDMFPHPYVEDRPIWPQGGEGESRVKIKRKELLADLLREWTDFAERSASVPSSARPALLVLTEIKPFVRRLRRRRFDPSREASPPSPPAQLWRMWKGALLGIG